MKLSQYARKNNITYRTAWNHWKEGKLTGYVDESNHIVLTTLNSRIEEEKTYTYARVSSSMNKNNLKSQSERLIAFCNANGWKTHKNIMEIGSGLNDNRKQLIKLLSSDKPTRLVVEHKDRLTRFGFNYIQLLCNEFNCQLIVVNETQTDEEDLIQDFVSVITSFCARIYGKRRSKRKTEKLIEELKND
jgi:putative resolvase